MRTVATNKGRVRTKYPMSFDGFADEYLHADAADTSAKMDSGSINPDNDPSIDYQNPPSDPLAKDAYYATAIQSLANSITVNNNLIGTYQGSAPAIQAKINMANTNLTSCTQHYYGKPEYNTCRDQYMPDYTNATNALQSVTNVIAQLNGYVNRAGELSTQIKQMRTANSNTPAYIAAASAQGYSPASNNPYAATSNVTAQASPAPDNTMLYLGVAAVAAVLIIVLIRHKS